MNRELEEVRVMSPAAVRAALENIFLELVERGEKAGLVMALERWEYFNVNCVDKHDKNALMIALQNGTLVILELLVNHPAVELGDILLRAVHIQMLPAVEIICQGLKQRHLLPDGLACHATNDDFHADMTPAILAAHHNNYAILKVLLDHGAHVPLPESFNFKTREFSLEHSIGTINIYRAITSEACLCLTSEDPFKDAFTLSHNMRKLSVQDFEFRADYTEMARNCEDFAANLLNYVKDSAEQQLLMTNCSGRKKNTAKIGTAIRYSQKKFVAHSHCQQFLVEKWYNGLSHWKNFSSARTFLLSCLFAVCYPILSLCYVFAGSLYPGKLLKVPYVRFVCHVSSLLIFLLLLALEMFVDNRGRVWESGGDVIISLFPTTIEILKFLWIAAFTWSEIHEIWCKRGRYLAFNKQAKLFDLFTLGLYWSWIALRVYAGIMVYIGADVDGLPTVAVATLRNASLDGGESRNLLSINCSSNGTFRQYTFESLAQADSLVTDLRDLGSLECILTNVEGEAPGESSQQENARARRAVSRFHNRGEGGKPRSKLSAPFSSMASTHPFLLAEGILAVAKVLSFLRLARMTVVHFQIGPMQISFGRMGSDICKFLVIFSVVLFAFSVGMHQLFYLYNKVQCSPNTDCSEHMYTSIPRSIITLFWTLFGMVHTSSLQAGDDGWPRLWFTEAVANILFALYHVVAVLVLMNVLIAMMSHTYQRIEGDADMEWKYARSLLWLYFLEDTAALAPPFNLLQIIPCAGKLIKQKVKKEKLLPKGSIDSEYRVLTQKITDRYVFDKLLQEDKDDPTMLKLKQNMFDFKYDVVSTLDSLTSTMKNIEGAVCDDQDVGQDEPMNLTASLKTAIADAEKFLPIRPETFMHAFSEEDEEDIRFAGDSSGEDGNG